MEERKLSNSNNNSNNNYEGNFSGTEGNMSPGNNDPLKT